MGRGHLGIVPLPCTDDSFEQPQVNFRAKTGSKLAHREINLLVFGGSRFKDREPNNEEYTDMCLMLTIYADSDMYELKHLPGAKLQVPDKFYGNMVTRCDANSNTVTVIGQKAAHRINTGRREIA